MAGKMELEGEPVGASDVRVGKVTAANGQVVEVPVDQDGRVVVFWLDTAGDIPAEAIRNDKGQVLNTAVKLANGYITVPVDAERTPLDAPATGTSYDPI